MASSRISTSSAEWTLYNTTGTAQWRAYGYLDVGQY